MPLAFCAILVTALAAFAGAPIWTALFGAAVLFSISYREQRKLAARFANLGASPILTAAHWQSAGHALIAGGAAYVIGCFARLAIGA